MKGRGKRRGRRRRGSEEKGGVKEAMKGRGKRRGRRRRRGE
jgi:hypothetical protein